MNKTKIHATAGGIAFLTILGFWTATTFSEFFASHQTVATVKLYILYGMVILIPALIVTGITGFGLAGERNETALIRKKHRMPIIAATGALVLLPAAFYLESKAASGAFDTWFYAIQALELLAGASNLRLMFLNIRDGLRLTGKSDEAKPTTDPITIQIIPSGPLMLKGSCPVAQADGSLVKCRPVTALCRCGASQDKPYCDGSHNQFDFDDSTDSQSDKDRLIAYKGEEINVYYNPLSCSHAAHCVSRLNAVFNTQNKPWIQPDEGSVSEIKAVIKACPSGALSYGLPEEEPQHLVEANQGIQIEKNGPYLVQNIALSHESKPTGSCPDKYVLCRCGASKNKPFCDGSHARVKWADD